MYPHKKQFLERLRQAALIRPVTSTTAFEHEHHENGQVLAKISNKPTQVDAMVVYGNIIIRVSSASQMKWQVSVERQDPDRIKQLDCRYYESAQVQEMLTFVSSF